MELNFEYYKKFIDLCNSSQYKEAEILLKSIIVSVVSRDGVELNIEQNKFTRDSRFDYIGNIVNGKIAENIVVDLKISKTSLFIANIGALLSAAYAQDIKNVILVSNNRLTEKAKVTAYDFADKTGINFQFLGEQELNQWFSTYKQPEPFINNNSVHLMIKEFSRELAKRISSHPEEYMDIEWRDLERIIATVFSDFGYNVTLTPSAKDGGKDVIVWYKGESYIIEIKHWSEKSRVGKSYIKDFLKVVLKENRRIGLYLSSSGYTANAFETLSQIEKIHFRFGDKHSIQTLLKMYEKVNNGIYIPVNDLEQIIPNFSNKVE